MKHINQCYYKYTTPPQWMQSSRRVRRTWYIPSVFIYIIKPFFAIFLLISCIVQAFDTGFYFIDHDYTTLPAGEWSTYIWWIIKSGTVTNDSLTIQLIQRFYDPNFNPQNTQPAIYYIKFLIDVALSFIAFFALCFLIYYLYIVFFSNREEWISNAKWYALNAFIAIILIGLSRMIVSFAFYIYEVLINF